MKTNTFSMKQGINTTKGFSLVELTVAVVVIAAVATIGFNAVAKIKDSTRIAKLEKDVKTLNSAANVYVASGGSLDGIVLPQDVINKMKTKASAGTAETIVGITGSFVDPRIRAVMASDSDAGLARAVWNTTTNRFELGTAGVGAKEFALDAPLIAAVEEDRSTAVAYGTEDNWVWDYTDVVATRNAPNTNVMTADVLPADPSASGGVAVTPLPEPQFSIAGGTYPAANFPDEPAARHSFRLRWIRADHLPGQRRFMERLHWRDRDHLDWIDYRGSLHCLDRPRSLQRQRATRRNLRG